jgi:hypothetical protein
MVIYGFSGTIISFAFCLVILLTPSVALSEEIFLASRSIL